MVNLKAFAHHNLKLDKSMEYFFDMEKENTVEKKGENAGYQHFLLSPQCFLHSCRYRGLVKGYYIGKQLLHTLTVKFMNEMTE